MIKQYINLVSLLFASWMVYGYCQNDIILAAAAAVMSVGSLLMRRKTGQKQYAFFDRIPLSAVIIISVIAGFGWRGIYPPPDDAVSPFPGFTAALQSGSIIASLILWLKPFSKKNVCRLFFLAWLTAALSVNVPFTNSMLVIFCSFCIIGTAVVILHTTRKPNDKKHLWRHYRGFTFFSILLVMLTTGVFYGIAKSIVLLDHAFMSFMSDYVLPGHYTHFLKIDPILRLVPPGQSAWDKRPVLEVDVPSVYGAYLKTQIFENFDNGIWLERDTAKETPLASVLPAHLPAMGMTMFTSFEHIVPSPYGVAAASGNRPLTITTEGIVWTEDDQRTRILKFALTAAHPAVHLTSAERQKYLTVPDETATILKEVSSAIAADAPDDLSKAARLRDYFLYNFKYSLNVPFRADNEGIIQMILKRRPAYCTYFATALTLLLRAQGIPARVATGFLVDEKIDTKKNTFLARVFDAHAWVEALLPDTDPVTGLERSRWQIMDPTPPGERAQAIKRSILNVSKIADRLWLAGLRFNAYLENLDKDKLKKDAAAAMLLVLLLINGKKIGGRVYRFIAGAHKKSLRTTARTDPLHGIYRHYEHYLKKTFGETRALTDTDTDVINRLKKHPQAPLETIARIESFLCQYHAARFGLRKVNDWEGMIRWMEDEECATASK